MKFVAQFDVTSNQNWERGVPVTEIFTPNTTLEDVYKWVKANTGHGQYDYFGISDIRHGQYNYFRTSDIRLSIVEE